MPDQAPNIEQGGRGRLIYDKERRTIVSQHPDLTKQQIIEEAYRRFPDETEPSDHPLGKLIVDRGNLRFAFVEGANFVAPPRS